MQRQNCHYGASPTLSRSSSASMLPSGHAAVGASVVRIVIAGTVVGDQKLAHVSVECLKRHPGWREEVLADGCKAPRRGWERPAGEPGEDPLLGAVERFVGDLSSNSPSTALTSTRSWFERSRW